MNLLLSRKEGDTAMDQATFILSLLLPPLVNGQLGLLSSLGGISSLSGGGFFPSSISSISNFLPLSSPDPVTSPPPSTSTHLNPHVAALGANAGLKLVSGILGATGNANAAKVGNALQLGNTLISDLDAIHQYKLSLTTTASPPPKPLKGLKGPDGVEYVIIDGRLYSIPSIEGGVPITQSPLPTPPPIYVPYGPATLNLPKSPSSTGLPFYAYCPLLTRYGETNVWCFLYDKRLRRVGFGLSRPFGEREERRDGEESSLETDNLLVYDPSLFVYTLL